MPPPFALSKSWWLYPVLLSLLVAVDVRAQRRLSLDDALALATSTSEQTAVARAGVLRADANVRRTEAQGLPQLNGSASYTRTLANQFSGITSGGEQQTQPECTGPFQPDPSLPLEERVRLLEQRLACPSSNPFGGLDFSQLGFGAANTWNLGLAFNWQLFTFGRTEAQVRASQAAREVARANVSATDAQARLDVTRAYFDAQLASELVTISEQSLATSEETLRITELREREGAQAEFDVLQARVSRDNQRPVLIRRQTDKKLAFDRLRALIDVDEELILTTAVTDAAKREVVVSDAQRVPVQQAEQRLRAAKEQLTAARAERMPTINATSQYGLVAYSDNLLPSTSDFRNNWTVGANIQIPIYTGGRIAADVDAARADVQEAEAQLERTVENARLDTGSALAALRAAEAAFEATRSTVEEAERGYDIARLRYREGVGIPLEIENARLQLEQARVNRAQAARDLWIAQTRVELLPFLPMGVP